MDCEIVVIGGAIRPLFTDPVELEGSSECMHDPTHWTIGSYHILLGIRSMVKQDLKI